MTHRIVFLGSPEFAVPSLRSLADDPRFDVALVVSQPDRKAGRGRKLTPPPVAQRAIDHGLDLFQPETLRTDEAVARLEAVQPDLLVVVAYGEILTRRALGLSSSGALNVHPSLLPAYRGASPIPAAIINGDSETGVSIMQMVRKLDAGPIVHQSTCPVLPDDTAGSLAGRLSDLAAAILPDIADDWIVGRIEAIPQDDSRATYTREWTKADARIDWSQPAVVIDRLIRASIPWPVAWTEHEGVRVQIRAAVPASEPDDRNVPPGTVTLTDGNVFVATGSGALQLLAVQPASKRAMPAADWARNAGNDRIKLT